MSRVGLEPTIPVFEWAKSVHALDRAATVIGETCLLETNIFYSEAQWVIKRITMIRKCDSTYESG
jgi:hypothetical protein